ncbi:MAG: hypothetical protein HY329_18620 [Chloroflexi bacterium]|nr:hypothetical protein [Chloroflexota bacterium]
MSGFVDAVGRAVTGFIATVGCCVVGVTVAATEPGLLIPLVPLAGAVALLWRPAQILTRRLERRALGDSSGTDRRIQQLEAQIESLRREQMRLQETVQWQERLLDQHVARAEGERVAAGSGAHSALR